MTKYAEKTSVSWEKSRNEIEATLRRYGATGFAYGWQEIKAIVAFEMNNRHIKFVLPMPDKNDKEFIETLTGRTRSAPQAEAAYNQAIRQCWRALLLIIKAKLEAVESGIVFFEEEFLAHIVLPDGATVGSHMLPQIETAYRSGDMPPMLPYAGGDYP